MGGYLFGNAYVDGETAAVEVCGAYPITSRDATVASFRFEIDDSVQAERFQAQRFPGTEVVGWYHTHPGHGVFMSSVDAGTQARYFRLFHRVALVIDPQRKELGAFVLADGDVHSLAAIHVVEDPPGTATPVLPLPPLRPAAPPPLAPPVPANVGSPGPKPADAAPRSSQDAGEYVPLSAPDPKPADAAPPGPSRRRLTGAAHAR